MAEGAPLLREYGLKAHRGFESLSLRQIPKAPVGAFGICGAGGFDEDPWVRAEQHEVVRDSDGAAGDPEGVRARGQNHHPLSPT